MFFSMMEVASGLLMVLLYNANDAYSFRRKEPVLNFLPVCRAVMSPCHVFIV